MIKDELNSSETPPEISKIHSHELPPHFSAFSLINEGSLKNIIMVGNSKSCRLDPMPKFLLESILPILLPVLSMIMNEQVPCLWCYAEFTKNSNYDSSSKKTQS